MVIFGDHTRVFKFIDFDFVLGADGVKVLRPNDKVDSKFFFSCLQNVEIKNLGYSRHYKELKDKKIPLPPLSIQKKIVEKIESFQLIIDGAKQVVAGYKPQIDIQPDWEMVELGEVCALEYGFTDTAKESGDARFIRITDISEEGTLKEADIKFVDLNANSQKYLLNFGDLVVARTGATYGKTLHFEEKYPAVFASFLIRLNFDNNKVLNKYYWIFTLSDDYLTQKQQLMTGGGQPQFNANAIAKIKFPLPPLEEQKQIVAHIEREQSLVNASRELINIFEQKIKDEINKLWEN
ncbi:MAG: restriction endonuclease subunit S [Pyrinomonadaceae bacterium]